MVLLSDGSDNAGGVDTATLAGPQGPQVPIHTVGFGREQIDHDVELIDVQTPASAFANSRVVAQVSFRQRGFAGKKAKVSIRDGNTVLAMRRGLTRLGRIAPDRVVDFPKRQRRRPHDGGIHRPVPGEENTGNNRMLRVMDVDAAKPRILYVEGEPRWEFKFIRRAMDEDQTIQLVTLLRATQNKNYRQGIADPKELDEGFPSKREELFGYSGLVIGSVEANWMTTSQHEMIRDFVDKRGGGVLFLGGRFGLSDGGYNKEPFTDLLPVTLPARSNTYRIEPAYSEVDIRRA